MDNECECIKEGSLLFTLVCDFVLKLYISVFAVDDEDVIWTFSVSEDEE